MARRLPRPNDLTPRQREVLALVAKGLTNPEICGVLGISRGTVKIHLAAIYRVLDVTNRTEAAVALAQLEALANTAPARAAEATFGRRAIAVLPFDNLSGDREDDAFADGLAEELITRLSRFRWFAVIARQSSFQYRGEANDLVRVGRELGAAYLVEGSVRRGGNRIRVTVQLIDAMDGAHTWAETYDLELADVFVIQDEIARRIAASLHPELLQAAHTRARRDARPDPDAWLTAVRGHAHLERRERVENGRAIECFERALALDPDSLLAAFGAAMAHYDTLFLQWSSNPIASLQKVEEYAAYCARIAPDDAFSLCAQGIALLLTGDIQHAIAKLRESVDRNPSYVRALSSLGQLVAMHGDPDEGIRLIEQAIRLSPRDPMLFWMVGSIGSCHFVSGRLEDAYDSYHRSIELRDSEPLVWALLVATTALLGRSEEARLALDELRRVSPSFSLAAFARVVDPARAAYIERLAEGLRLAGYVEPAQAS
ncbi:MAG TPA: LuxR C-terminal-related transcriptional regulator [Myxococcota bacterium]|nr:LuxR C-terminal-related transcriptional regulator [Myxococcota bacterium]